MIKRWIGADVGQTPPSNAAVVLASDYDALEARRRKLEADLAEETEAHDAWKKLCIEKEQRIAEIEKTGEDFFCRVAAGYPHVLAENQDVAQPFRICLGASTPETDCGHKLFEINCTKCERRLALETGEKA